MKIENTKAQMRKGVLEYCILSVLRDNDAYVAEILETLKDAKLLVVEGTIYPLLTRLKNAGLLLYRWEESTGGPPRKYYGLTDSGREFLKELTYTWEELQTAVTIVTTQKIRTMNKTVNINLAGIFFHIDETAYAKLQHYLEAIKRSLTNTQGQDEIIADIEARIAELFNEKIKTERQVIGIKEVDEVIAVLGQPEDYMLDEEIFDDEPVQPRYKTSGKQLFRDTEHSYIGGVSSGLGHYLGIGTVWVRLLWILLTILSSGAFILIYIALWIFVPEAKTTADKLSMRGEEVNISNIERKIREGFDDVTGKVKSVDYEKYGNQARSGASNAAKGVGSGILFLLNIFVKLIGIFILLVAGTTLIGLFIGLFTVGTFGIIDAPWTDYIEMAAIGAPLWFLSLLIFLAVGIPFFFLFILGLKILVNKLKTIGTTAKLVLLGLWLLSIIGLAVIGIQQATQRAFEGEVVITEALPVRSQDTLYLAMQNDSRYSSGINRGSVTIKYDDKDNKVIYSTDIRLVVKSTKDSTGRIEIIKMADGSDFRDARDRADQINYNTSFENNRLFLDSFLTSDFRNHFREQEVRVTIYLPEGTTLYADRNISSFHRSSDYYGNILDYNSEEKYLTIEENKVSCENCDLEESEESEEWENSTWDQEVEESDSTFFETDTLRDQVEININKQGVQVKNNNAHQITLNKDGISIKKIRVMNALIKVIITSIIGFIGPLETNEDTRLHVNAENRPVLEFLYIDPEANIYCRFDEFLCKKLNNNISPG